ncbi:MULTISPECIES: biofilm regulation phosphoprotein SiaC [Halomonas]|uniref:biofilm regulation phosphoprotein SiaC n=1 Tax=Halomonas TaxID=2745 RepID=UPI0021BBD9C0|nr:MULTISPECIES: biofilm regulation phosphoprotein SiaC [Halomonas]
MINDLAIDGTQSTPDIRSDWEAGRLTMRGDSYPENTFELYSSVLSWVDAYLRSGDKPLCVQLDLVYLNTSSVKAMMDIFDLMEEAHQEGTECSVDWRYDVRNERIAELAEEFKEDCSFPFAITPIEEVTP